MRPVKTEKSNIVYKGPSQDIGDLWCERARLGLVRTIWEPDEDDLELLKAGGRIQLSIYREPIPPVQLRVLPKEETEPIGKHGWKINVEPGDVLKEKEKIDGQDEDAEQTSQGADESASLGETSEAVPSRAPGDDAPDDTEQ